jgi:hypothetical protein
VEANVKSRSLDMPLATILDRPRQEWEHICAGSGRVKIARNINIDWKEYTQDNYLFSHCTIVASVDVEDNFYHIKPACSDLVNNNGNAWSNPVLISTFRTFVGAENYLEHVQIPELSKGKILDVVLRPVNYENKMGQKAQVYYADILVATERKHTDLINRIASGEMDSMSMGCIANHVQCSHCGTVLGDNDPNCTHIASQLGQEFVDKNGVKRIVAELCGRMIYNASTNSWEGDPNSVRFIEASWVDKPAFVGAVLNHSLSEIPKAASILQFPTNKLAETVEDIFRMRVADVSGMMVLRVAQEELRRRSKEEMVSRVARSLYVAR